MKQDNQFTGRDDGHDFERAQISRRVFLGSAAAASAAGLSSATVASPLFKRGGLGLNRDTIVSIYLRGAMDGISGVVPYADPDYAPQRLDLAVPPPGVGANRAIDLDGFFGLNPLGQKLMRPYGDGQLLFVHATGMDAPNRSHFDAQERMESAAPATQGGPNATGWLGRHMASSPPPQPATVRGIGIDSLLARSLVGAPASLPVKDIGSYEFPGRQVTRDARRSILQSQYSASAGWLSTSAAATLNAIDLLESVDYANYTPSPGANYPATKFGEAMAQVAALIKADISLETAQVNLGGWDHHENMGPLDDRFAALWQELAEALEAFYVDLDGTGHGYTLMAQTEFGRRIKPNSNAGTDHGFGSAMILMGPSVVGGRVLSQWPGMAPDSSQGAGDGDQVNGDLAVTIDWRDIAAEVLERRGGATALSTVFPGYSPIFRGAVI